MTLIISAVAWVMALLFLPETYLPVLLDWKSRQLRHGTGDKRYASDHSTSSLFQRVKGILPLPIIFFSTEPVIAVLGAYLTLLYSIMFTFLSGFDYIFQRLYDLSTGQTGSCFGAIAVGATIATFAAPALYAWTRQKTKYRTWRYTTPRIPPLAGNYCRSLFANRIILAGVDKLSDHLDMVWPLCVRSFRLVLMSIYISSYEYIIDSYGEHAASALASITMVRYIVAGGMVMASRPMYEGIGVHWTMTILGCLSVLLAPMPLVFKSYGAQLRERSRYADSPVGMPNS